MVNDELIRFETILLDFERAWRDVKRAEPQTDSDSAASSEIRILPSVHEFADRTQTARDSLWDELTRIDLEHRLTLDLPIVNDDYQATLDRMESIANRDDLLRYEFELRQKFNQRPTLDELDSRFGPSCNAIRELLPDDSTGAELQTVVSPESTTGNFSDDNSLHLGPGATVDHYIIKKQIGVGAFATVFLATDKKLGRDVAIKFLRLEFSRAGNFRERMLREAHAVAGLQHPGIVPVFETGRYLGSDYIVSQFVNGCDLESVLEQREFPVAATIGLIGKLAIAIDHAHQHGVIHRDIKPANIMLDDDDQPLLLDFGLAHIGNASIQLTHAGEIMGTPAFMPPEQADGRGWQADPRSDLYSLGVILFRMICKRLPFEGNATIVIHNVIHQQAPNPRRMIGGVDRDLQTIILKCLEKDPADRYQTGKSLASDLNKYSDGKSIDARPIGIGLRTLKWSRRKPILAGLMVALLLVSSFVVGIGTQLNSVSLERDRAVQAERKSRRTEVELEKRLATEAAAAGRLAMQRGQLRLAITFFENSLKHGNPQSLDLHFLMLSAFVATRQIDRALEELAIIELDEAHTQRMGDILIWKAELALDGRKELGDPVALFEASKDHELPETTRTYVQAMLADSSLDALKEFRAVLTYDHFHHRARRMLITILISLGRDVDAELESNIAIELFPEDSDFLLYKALIHAKRGQLNESQHQLDLAGVSLDERNRWEQFCRLVDRLSNHYSIHSGQTGYRIDEITELAEEFSNVCLPLTRERGWHFPPRIGMELEHLPDILTIPVDLDSAESIVEQLRTIVGVHPEGSLYSLLSERLIAYQNLLRQDNSDGFTSVSVELIVEALIATEQAIERSAIVSSAHDAAWTSVYANAISLAVLYKIDVEKNSKRAINAAMRIDEDQISRQNLLRGLTVGLLELKQYDEAERFALRWVKVTHEEEFDAVWHLLLCDRFRDRWYDVLVRCNELSERFPENKNLRDLANAAKGRIKSALDPVRQVENPPRTEK